MKIILMSMPDVAPIVFNESALHLPNLGIASIGANIDEKHDVYIADLVRKRRQVGKYVTMLVKKIRPDVVGLSSMAWQYDTCTKIFRLIKRIAPHTIIVLGGYHATLMYEEIAASPDAALVDFMVRGEGEIPFNQLLQALENKRDFNHIPSLSHKQNDTFIHNERGPNIDLSELKRPIRDKRRLTWGYHMINSKSEVLETSRGCLRSCNFCSVRHMYGRSFRTFPIKRIMEEIDEIYYNKKTRKIFIIDDNIVLDSERLKSLCKEIIERNYRKLQFIVQADCTTMASDEEMVALMARAGFKIIFLGIENVSEKNLRAIQKGNIVEKSKKAVKNCHRHGISVVAGLVLGFPEDDKESLIKNYQFLNELKVDAAYCQILTPYPKTELRNRLMNEGLVTNPRAYKYYNGIWANVRTRFLTAESLQYYFWYYRQTVVGWWQPSENMRKDQKIFVSIWLYLFKPVLKLHIDRVTRKLGWKGRYEKTMKRLAMSNHFPDLESGK